MRAPAMVLWPGEMTAGVVSDEMLSVLVWFKTLASLASAADKVPTDRPMDGVDASKFLVGESEHTGRDALLFFGPDGSLMSVKRGNIKICLCDSESIEKQIVTPQFL